jgi:hypothetical protein
MTRSAARNYLPGLISLLLAASCSKGRALVVDASAGDTGPYTNGAAPPDAGGAPDQSPRDATADGSPAPFDGPVPPPDARLDGGTPAALCTATGGRIGTATCCILIRDFPPACILAVGACSCAPAYSHVVATCECPSGQCFTPDRGCAPSTSCTPGRDETCSEDPSISSLRGRCQWDGTCTCLNALPPNPSTGKCP